MFNYHVVNDDRRGQLGVLSSVSSSLMMIITTIYVPIYSVLITAALMLHLDGEFAETCKPVLKLRVLHRDCNELEL